MFIFYLCLPQMCRTRWIECLEAFEVFVDLFLPIFSCLESISNSRPAEWNKETRSDAHSLLLAISRFSFIFSLVLTQRVLAYTMGLSIKLQGRYIDVVRAHRDIETVIDTLKDVRSGINVFHTNAYKQAVSISRNVDIDESAPRQAGRQQHRHNVQSDSISEHFKLNYTIPLLDHLVSEMNDRFNKDFSNTLEDFKHLLPSEISNCNSHLQPSELSNLMEFYQHDFPSINSFEAELHLWCNKWKATPELAVDVNTLQKLLPYTDYDYFPNIHTLLRIILTLPVTSCECERSISVLRFLKTCLRSTMSQERLNGLAMLQYHKDMHLEAKEVAKEFAQRQPRRLSLFDPFGE